jgi:hypothetical protein
MRLLALALAFALAGCAGVTGVEPPQMGASEMQVRPGMFSGPYGEFVIAGEKGPPEAAAEEEVGAGS